MKKKNVLQTKKGLVTVLKGLIGQTVDLKLRLDPEWHIDLFIVDVNKEDGLLIAQGLLNISEGDIQDVQQYNYCFDITRIDGFRTQTELKKTTKEKVIPKQANLVKQTNVNKQTLKCPHCQDGILEVLDKGTDGNTLMSCKKCSETCTLTVEGEII